MADVGFQVPATSEARDYVASRHRGAPTNTASRIQAELKYVRDQLSRIVTLADAGSFVEGREVSADLLFDFQPLIVASADLLSETLDALDRCNALALRRRLLIAAHGDQVEARSSAQRPAGEQTIRRAEQDRPWRVGAVTAVPA